MSTTSEDSEPPTSSVPSIPHIMVLKNRLRYADGLKNSLDFRSLYTEICPHSKTLLVSEEKQQAMQFQSSKVSHIFHFLSVIDAF